MIPGKDLQGSDHDRRPHALLKCGRSKAERHKGSENNTSMMCVCMLQVSISNRCGKKNQYHAVECLHRSLCVPYIFKDVPDVNIIAYDDQRVCHHGLVHNRVVLMMVSLVPTSPSPVQACTTYDWRL